MIDRSDGYVRNVKSEAKKIDRRQETEEGDEGNKVEQHTSERPAAEGK